MKRVMERVGYAAYIAAERKKAEDEAEKERGTLRILCSILWILFLVRLTLVGHRH